MEVLNRLRNLFLDSDIYYEINLHHLANDPIFAIRFREHIDP